MKTTTLSVITAALLSLGACSPKTPNAELDAANKKIAALEAELALEKAKNAPVPVAGAAASAPVASAAAVAETVVTGKQWNYDVSEDKMDGGTTYFANVYSTNSVNFDFPYSGLQNAKLTLRAGYRQGKDVIFSIRKGQILCPSYQDCTVLVRFDDEKPVNYSAVAPADNSSDTIFLRNYEKFLGKLQKAKRVRIAVDIFQEGAPVFEFDVSGFDRQQYQPKK
ncbi:MULTISPECIES: hypothetical protein [Janthinobacterium]|uniref:Lipoprotein n=1 Tax=Janthinobacterium lividum TaxID=29581 RepID=A0ABU0XLK0_9BURK|nr:MULTISPECIES: hypothetical protein [Janthinobacterium]MCC7713124.1 hypothetical protein [Janthinobacterium lividum]MDQ4624405.1 hypothetical protein [Janthinobacterium lividum]MDQ4673991.1 hypothetical protein [Janthinobacterium lividum]MDQ4684721.1 hypothetical protein [Janthinobacterium lividum]OEZ50576.1 hypothetical protein JAB1_16910 [Janthinobacterium sp. MP5059B]